MDHKETQGLSFRGAIFPYLNVMKSKLQHCAQTKTPSNLDCPIFITRGTLNILLITTKRECENIQAAASYKTSSLWFNLKVNIGLSKVIFK